MTQQKRPRGRPRGTGKDDAPHLARVADLLVPEPSLKPTTAMKRVMAHRTWLETDETLLRRWQSKWQRESQPLLSAARERARPRPATTLRNRLASFDSVGKIDLSELAELGETVRAFQDAFAFPELHETIKVFQSTMALSQLHDAVNASQALLSVKELSETVTAVLSAPEFAPYQQAIEAFQESLKPSKEFVDAITSFQNSVAEAVNTLNQYKFEVPRYGFY